jgi:hypothetical protein
VIILWFIVVCYGYNIQWMLTYVFVSSHGPNRLVNHEIHWPGVNRRVEQCRRIYDLKNEIDKRCVMVLSHWHLESRPKNDCPFLVSQI